MDDLHILDIDIQQIGVKSALEEAVTRKNPDVMISLHCATMKNDAVALQKQFTLHNVSTWVCLDMSGGAAMRDDINWAAMNCKVFVALMNENWAKSGECKWEFNIAIRCGITQSYPVIIPVVVDNLDFNKYIHIKAIMANTNGIFFDRTNLTKTHGEIFNSVASILGKKAEIVEEIKEKISKESILEELKQQNKVLSSLKEQVEQMIKVNQNFMEKVNTITF